MFIHPNGPALSHRHYKIRSLAKFPRHDTLMNVYLCTATQRTCTIMVTKNDKINETFFLSLIDKFGVRILKYIQFFLKYDNNTWLNLCTEQNSTIHSFLKLQAQWVFLMTLNLSELGIQPSTKEQVCDGSLADELGMWLVAVWSRVHYHAFNNWNPSHQHIIIQLGCWNIMEICTNVNSDRVATTTMQIRQNRSFSQPRLNYRKDGPQHTRFPDSTKTNKCLLWYY